jgi:hypothetical protein
MAFWEQEATNQVELQQSVRIALCIPHTGQTTYAHVLGLVPFIMGTGGYHIIFLTQSGTPVDLSRNIMVTRGLQQNVGKFFFVDSDMILDQNVFPNLLAANLPVISAAYMSRSPPFDMMANVQGRQLSKDTAKNPVRQYITVDEVGAGCLLVDRIVFERIAQKLDTWRCMTDHKPEGYEKALKLKDAEARSQNYTCKLCGNLLVAPFFWNRIGFFDNDAVSEDYWFCKLAQRAGFDVTVVNNLVVKHEVRIADWYVDENGLQTRSTNAGMIEPDPSKRRPAVGVIPQ